MTLLLSDVTACGGGAGAAACRAPAVAQETDSASNGYKDRRIRLPSGPGLLHEFDDERLSHELGLHDPPGGLRGHVHRERHPRPGHRDAIHLKRPGGHRDVFGGPDLRSEEHTSELQSRSDLVCRLLLEKKKASSLAHRRCEGALCQTY